MLRILVLLPVVPVWIAVLRAGLHGLYPTSDAALTVLRARSVISGSPPLVGMPAAGANLVGDVIAYFPGAWQLYVLAVPVRVLGDVWGPPVAMGLLNSIWIVLTGWLLIRLLPKKQAVVAIAFLAVFCWSTTTHFLITPVPMEMVTFPFALFLVATWATATGERTAVPILAVVANYLWLSHLVLVLVVPVVGVCAIVGLALWFRRVGADESACGREQIVQMKRALFWAFGVTVFMWIPTLVQQFSSDPGNLYVLVDRFGAGGRGPSPSWSASADAVLATFTRPPFWFRGSLSSPPYFSPAPGPGLVGVFSVYDLVVGIAAVGIVAVIARTLRRRHDHVGVAMLSVAAVAVVVNIVSAHFAPQQFGFSMPVGYLRALAAMAMFVWLTVVIGALRAFDWERPRFLTVPAIVGVLVFTALNVPVRSSTDRRYVAVSTRAQALNNAVIERFGSQEPIGLKSGVDFESMGYLAALRLGLETAGVEYCLYGAAGSIPASEQRCDGSESIVVTINVAKGPPGAPGPNRVVIPYQSSDDRQAYERLRGDVVDRLEPIHRLELTANAQRQIDELNLPGTESALDKVLQPFDGDVGDIVDSASFAQLLTFWYDSDRWKAGPLFQNVSLDGIDVRELLRLRQGTKSLVATVSPR